MVIDSIITVSCTHLELNALELFNIHALPVLGKLVVGDALSEHEREIVVGGLLGRRLLELDVICLRVAELVYILSLIHISAQN